MLSKKLIARAERMGIVHDNKFRNMNGMMLMYQNVVYVATEGRTGMSKASSAMWAVYKMYVNAPEAFDLMLKEFNRKYH